MAVFLPVLKIALPYITRIVTAAVPIFTSRPASGKGDEIIAALAAFMALFAMVGN